MYHIVNTKKSPIPLGPYTQAIDTGNIVFVSGQMPMCPDTKTIPKEIYDQTYQALQNVKNIIETIHLNINNIVKTTLFITNIDDLIQINTSYKKFFDTFSSHDQKCINLPTRSCIEVSKLPRNAKIIIEAIAMRLL